MITEAIRVTELSHMKRMEKQTKQFTYKSSFPKRM